MCQAMPEFLLIYLLIVSQSRMIKRTDQMILFRRSHKLNCKKKMHYNLILFVMVLYELLSKIMYMCYVM